MHATTQRAKLVTKVPEEMSFSPVEEGFVPKHVEYFCLGAADTKKPHDRPDHPSRHFNEAHFKACCRCCSSVNSTLPVFGNVNPGGTRWGNQVVRAASNLSWNETNL